ncbi:repetitive proline-rich cell wall 1 [Fusarium sp. NRRL 25303]|nr:repetitive proline-rich cell wall 1 [Fusarium sp. NRRL 25303]
MRPENEYLTTRLSIAFTLTNSLTILLATLTLVFNTHRVSVKKMRLPAIVGAVGLLGTVVEAAPRGSWFSSFQHRRVARSPDGNAYDPPRYTPANKSTPINTYTPPRNTTTPTTHSTTLEPRIQCPSNYVFVSTKTVDVTVTVTASPDGSYYTTAVCHDCIKTLTISNTIYVPPGKYASTMPYGEKNTGYPNPDNSTYGAPYRTKNDYPSMNSTIGYSASTHTGYKTPGQSAVYSTADGYVSPPVYTKPVYTKPVYSDPTYGNSTGTQSGYVPPAYTKPVDTKPTLPGNSSTYETPIYTKPVDSPIYTPPVYTKPAYSQPIIPGNSSTVDPPVYTKPVETPTYMPPVYTKPVYSQPSNSSTIVPPVISTTSDEAVYTLPVYTKPVYTPPVYTDPAARSESSESSTVSIPTNSTIPPVLSTTYQDTTVLSTAESTTTSAETETPAETTTSATTSSEDPL